MDDDSCNKFIGSLTKYLQSLCHSYVDFDNGVELVGHIYLNVDTGKGKIDYVLNESVCKNGANVVKFTSNSYHAQPVEKTKKETTKKAPDPPKDDDKRKNDDDDVIIVGSEGSSRRNRTGSGASPSRLQGSPGGMQRGMAGQNRMGQQQGGVFRPPGRGMNPRLGAPMPRAGGYNYQPRQRLSYPGQPRNYMNYPRARQPFPQTHGPVPVGQPVPVGHAIRGQNPVDMDITFMREEYVAGQPRPPLPAGQQPGYPYQSHPGAPVTGAPSSMQPQPQQAPHMSGQHYMTPYTQAGHVPGQPPATMVAPGVPASHSLPTSLASTMANQAVLPGQEAIVSVIGSPSPAVSSVPSFFEPGQQAHPATSATGGMPLPVTTHTIFDSGPVMAPADPTGPQPTTFGDLANAGIAVSSASNPSTTVIPSPSMSGAVGAAHGTVETQPNFVIGQVWSESSETTLGTASQQISQSSVSYPQPPPSGQTVPSTMGSSGQNANVFDNFSLPAVSQQHHLPAQFSPSVHQTSTPMSAGGVGSGGEGDRFSALVSELQAFNQHGQSQPPHTPPHSQHLPSSTPPHLSHPSHHPPTAASPALLSHQDHSTPTRVSYPGYSTPTRTPTHQTESSPLSHGHPSTFTFGEAAGHRLKQDPGNMEESVATSVLHESTEAAAIDAPGGAFLAPSGHGSGHGGLEDFRKRSGSSSSHSRGTPSPISSSTGNLVGPESVVIETKPFLHQASDYDSGCDTASASTSERLASPQNSSGPQSHQSVRSISIPLVPLDSPSSRPLDIKQERHDEDNAQSDRLKMASSEWSQKTPDADWVTDMSALNNSDESEDEDDNDPQDDDDPNYEPGRGYSSEKGPAKRPRGRLSEKGAGRGKKRKVDHDDTGGDSYQQSENSPEDDQEMAHSDDYHSPEHESEDAEIRYKPGTFLLINVAKDSERPSRMRPAHTPAEVITTPPGQEDGLWVHTLVIAGNGLWRLPSVDQLVDLCVDPCDVVRKLEKANVKIQGSKVFYRFDDM